MCPDEKGAARIHGINTSLISKYIVIFKSDYIWFMILSKSDSAKVDSKIPWQVVQDRNLDTQKEISFLCGTDAHFGLQLILFSQEIRPPKESAAQCERCIPRVELE